MLVSFLLKAASVLFQVSATVKTTVFAVGRAFR
jgi:hypothetical protein